MGKQKILKFLLLLFVCSLSIFSLSYSGVSAFDSRSSKNTVYPKNTYIGMLDVTGKSQEEVRRFLEKKIKRWHGSSKFEIVYKEQELRVEPADFVFLLDESISSAADGKQNPLLIELKGNVFNGFEAIKGMEEDLDKPSLEKALIKAGMEFAEDVRINLEDYLPEKKPVLISSSTVELSGTNRVAADLANAFPTIEMAAKSNFSMKEWLAENNADNISASAISLISSAIYKAVLPTNILISERHISSSVLEAVEPGYEARVDFEKNLDFMLYNPNGQPIKIQLEMDDSRLKVSVTGVPLLYNYKVHAGEQQEFTPRTIKQYSALLQQGQKRVEQKGKAGILVKVSRDVYAKTGEWLKTETIAEDFYPPVHRIEIHPLSPAGKPSASGPGDSPKTLNRTGTQTAGKEQVGTGVNRDASLPDHSNQPDDKGEGISACGTNGDDGGLWGKPDEEPK